MKAPWQKIMMEAEKWEQELVQTKIELEQEKYFCQLLKQELATWRAENLLVSYKHPLGLKRKEIGQIFGKRTSSVKGQKRLH